jgi:hypothetical protein
VQIPLWWAGAAADATKSAAALVWIDLLHRAWRAKGQPFTMPNGWLAEWEVSRWTKARVLRQLEAVGLIKVEWRTRKNPLITLVDG